MFQEDIDFKEVETSLFHKHNELRTNPKSFIPKLRETLPYYKDKILHKPDEEVIQTYEGVGAVTEAINFLKYQDPVHELAISRELNQACRSHLNYIGPNGLTSHEGKGGSHVSERVEKFCEWDGALAENLDFGFIKPENILLNFLIDDGVKERFQRTNLFNPEFNLIGVAVGPHKEYGVCAVVCYCKNIRNLGSEPNDVSNFISEYIKKTLYKKNFVNEFQEDDPYAPDNTVSVKVEKEYKQVNGKIKKVTKKIYFLDTGAQHIIKIEDN